MTQVATPSQHTGAPQRVLSTWDSIAIIVGLVVGAGIFKLPSLVAGFTASVPVFYGVWIAGGVVSLIGALCYAELASAYPNAGGDYYFVQRAYGRNLSFLYAWARIAVITTGSIGVLGYTFGDYMSNIVSLGAQSSALWAGIAVIALTLVNLIGIRETKGTQNVLTTLEVLGLVLVIFVGVLLVAPAAPGAAPAPASEPKPWTAGLPLAILFVLFTYGGWNEGAYISAELKDKSRAMVRSLVVSLAIVTVLYLLVNYAYARSLGLAGMAKTQTVAADVLALAFGTAGAKVMSLVIAISALTSINSTVIVGARSNFALGRDWPLFGWLGRWDERADAPRNALVVQAIVALVLIALGAFTRKGFETMVEYTMPVFWFFFMLVGIGLIVLRRKEPATPRPFRVPLYPITPFIFIATCAYLFYSSVAYVKGGALFGIGVLFVGAVLIALGMAVRRAPA
jgi:amino acid transporter